jgi:signal transduction histidine kinase/ligand-binding sensor domain-containing protein
MTKFQYRAFINSFLSVLFFVPCTNSQLTQTKQLRILHKWKLVLLALLFLVQSVFPQDKVLRFDHLTVEDGLSQNTVTGIIKDKYGFMWFGTWGGLCRYDGYKFTVYKTEVGNPRSISNSRIHLIKKDNDGNIWLLPYDTLILCRYNYETDDFTRFARNKVKKEIADALSRTRDVSHLNANSCGYTWHVDRNYLLYQTNNLSHKRIEYIADPLNRWALNDGDVTDIYIDDDNMMWVGTYSGGVNKAFIEANPISYYYRSLKGYNCINDNNVRAVFQDNLDNLWVGTRSKGITKIDRKNDTYTYYQHSETNSNSLINDQIRRIFVDHFGQVWIGTKGGLDRFDQKNNKFFHYSTKSKNKIPHDWVYAVMEDDNNNLWIGTWNGIAKYNRKNDSFLWYDLKVFKLKTTAVRDFLEDRNKNYWLAIEGQGLLNLRKISEPGLKDSFQVINRYEYSLDKSNSLSDNLIYAICEDENGKIWAGTSNGLDKIDPENQKIVNFTMKEGLPDVTIIGVLSDRNGHLWVSHKKGISRLNIKTLTIKNFSIQDGLQGVEFSENACFRNVKTGEIFFGGTKGLNSFFPDSIKNDNTHLPKVVFTDLKIQNQSVHLNQVFNGRIILTRPIYLTAEITLKHQDKSFSIEFAGLHYTNPKGNKYKHILIGFDKEWIVTNANERNASYSNLDPGVYTLQVKASNSDGYWTIVPATLKIIVEPPWWQTWWFKFIALLVFVFSIYIAFSLRVSIYQKKQKELSVLVKKRTQEITQANEILLERQTRIEEYAEELRSHTENLREANDLLRDKQKLIETQAALLNDSNQQLRFTNEQLAILNSTKDRFFSIIAHDLRNPFNTVSGFANLLQKDYKTLPPEKIERFLNIISVSSTSGNNLLDNLLQWSRSQTGSILYNPTKLNLSLVANDTIKLLEGDAQRKEITIHSHIDQEIMVFADENMLKTIFRNLVSNGIKFTPEKGTITLTSIINDLFVEITIADTGMGIPSEIISKLFRIDVTVTTKGTLSESGTGLGLILCKEFVEKHNGKIWVESEEGNGSEFKFTLPLG